MGRSRWAAVGAAVAVSVGGGGLLTASAAPESAGAVSSTIAIVPCRFLDTRLSTGERTSPFSGGETVTFPAFGNHGGCTIPGDAMALVANVTTVNQSEGGYLTMFPAGADRPTISILNWSAGDGATGNEVTAKLAANGSFSMFNFVGTTDVVIDVVAYLVPASTGIGPKGDTGDTGIQGPAGTDGVDGTNGEPGVDGTNGTNGDPGTPGVAGTPGIQGIQGDPGAQGIQGDSGMSTFSTTFAAPAGLASLSSNLFSSSDWGLSVACVNDIVNAGRTLAWL